MDFLPFTWDLPHPRPCFEQDGGPAPWRRRELRGLESRVHGVVAQRAAGGARPAAAEPDGFGRSEVIKNESKHGC